MASTSDIIKLLEDLKAANKLTAEQAQQLARYKREAREVKKSAEETADSFQEMRQGLNDIGENFGVRLGEIFEQVQVDVEQASRDIASMFDDLQVKAPEIANEIAEEFNSSFRSALPDPKDIQAKINLNNLISEFKSKFPEMGIEMQKAFKTGDIATFYKKFGDEGMQNLQKFMKDKKGFGGMRDWFKPGGEGEKSAIQFRKRLEEFEPAAQKTTKVLTNWPNLFSQIGSNILNFLDLRGLINHVVEYDDKLSKLKREFVIPTQGFAKADSAMQSLMSKGAKFGLYMEESFAMVSKLGEEARSTNVKFLADTASALAAIPRATGIGADTVGEISGKMMFFGASAERARSAFISMQNSANRFGVSTAKVGKTFAEVFPRYARMGFKGGEESLARMAAKAEKMGVDLKNTLDMSDKFLDINSALEASADLSLLGGAASQISFIEIMRAAQEGGDALMDLTAKMTSDIGKLGTDGMIKLTGQDRQRMKAIAEATGKDLDSLINERQTRLQDSAKQAALPKNIVFGSLSPEEQDFLMSKMVKDKGGKWKFEGLDGLKDLTSIGKETIQAQMKAGQLDQKNIEARALDTRSFKETMDDFKNELKAEFAKFRPMLDSLKKVFDLLSGALEGFKSFMGRVFGERAAYWAKPIAVLGTILLLTFPKVFTGLIGGLGKVLMSPFKLLGGMGKGGAGGGGLFGKLFGGKGKTEAPSPSTGGGQSDISTQSSKAAEQKNIFSRILDGIKNILRSAINVIRTLVNGIGKILTDAIKVIANVGTKLINGVSDILKSVVNLVRNVGGQIIDSLSSLIQKISNLIKTSGTSLVNSFSQLLGSIINLISKQGSALINALSNILGSAIRLVNTQGVALANTLGNIGKAISDNFFKIVKSVFKGLSEVSKELPTILGNAGKAIGSFFQGMSTGLVAFAQAMAMPTALFGLPVGLIVLAMAMGIAAALRIAAPAIQALGPLFAGLGELVKGFAPVVEAAAKVITSVFNGIGTVIEKIGKVIASIIKEVSNSIMQMSNIPATKLFSVAGGIAAVSYALAAFGGGSLLGGIARGIGEFFGGDPVKKLTAFANINGANLINVGNGIKLVGSSLSSLGSVKIGGFVGELEKLGNLTKGPFKNIKDLSSIGPNIKKAVDTILSIALSLKNIPTVDLSNINKLAIVINVIGTNIKSGLNKLSSGIVSASLAKITANALFEITKSLNQIKDVKTSPFDSLSKILSTFMPGIKKGISIMGSGVLNFQIAKISASGLANVAKSLSLVPNIKTEPFVNLAKIMNTTMTAIKAGLSKLSGMVVNAQIARASANGLASVAKNLSTIPNIRPEPLLNLGKIMSQSMGQIKEGIKKLTSLAISSQVARIAVSGIASVAKSLNSVPLINPRAFELLSKILTTFMPGIKNGIGIMGTGVLNFQIARISASGLANVAKSLSLVPNIKSEPFINLAKIMNNTMPSIKAGLSKLSDMVINAQLARISANGLASVAKNLNTVPNIKPEPLLNLGKIMSQSMGQIKEGIKKLTSLTISAQIARIAVSGIASVAKSLNSVPLINPRAFEILSKILTAYMPGIKNGISLMGSGFAISSNIARITANGIKSTAKSLSSVPSINPKAFEILSKILVAFMPGIKNGISLMGSGFAVSSNIARITANGIKSTAKSLSLIPVIKSAPFEILSKILATYMPGIKKGISLMGSGFVVSSNIASITANGIKSTAKSLSLIPVIKSAPFEILSKILTIYMPGIKKGISMIGGAGTAVSSNVASLTAKALSKIGNSLNLVPIVKSAPFETLSKILTAYMPGIKKGISIIGGAGIAISSNIASLTVKALSKIGNSLNLVPMVKSAPFENLSKILTNYMPGIKKGISMIGGAGTAVSSNIASLTVKALSKIGNSLNLVPIVKSAPFEILSKILTVYMPGIKKGINMIGGAGTAISSNIASLTAKALSKIGNSLNLVPVVKITPFDNLNRILSNYVPGINKGIKLLGMGLVISANVAIQSSKALISVAKNLAMMPSLKSAPFEILSRILTNFIPNIKKGISLLGGSAVISANVAKLTAKAISDISKSFSKVINLKLTPFENLSKILSIYIPGIRKGIGMLGGSTVVSANIAKLTANAILSIAKRFSNLPTLKLLPFDNLSKILTLYIPNIRKGVNQLGAGSLVVFNIAKSTANALKGLMKNLSTVPMLKTVPFETLSKILTLYIPSIKKGISLLGGGTVATFFLARGAVNSLKSIANNLSGVTNVKTTPFESLSKIFNLYIPTIKKGINNLGSGSVINATLARITATHLVNISKKLNSVPLVKTSIYDSLVTVLLVKIPLISIGLKKLSSINSQIKSATGAVVSLSKNLLVIGNSLSIGSQFLLKGLINFSKIVPYAIQSRMSTNLLILVTRNLQLIKPLNTKNLLNVANTIHQISLKLSVGLIALSKAGFYAIPAMVTSRSLITITRNLNLVKPVSAKTLNNLASTLSSSSGLISKGVRMLGGVLPFILPAIITSRGLVSLSSFLSKVQLVPIKNIFQLGYVTNNAAKNISKGLIKFSGMLLFLPLSIVTASGLVKLSSTLSKVQLVSYKNILQLGGVLNNSGALLLRGLMKFSLLTPFVATSIYVANGLVKLTSSINKIQGIFYKNLLQLGNVLATRSSTILSGLIKFSAMTPFVGFSIFTSRRLVSLTKIINQIQSITAKNLSSLGSILNSTAGTLIKGMVKFATVAFFVGPAILSAVGVRKLSKILVNIVPVSNATLSSLATLLNTISGTLISGLIKWSAMLPFIVPAVIATYGVTKIFRALASIANLKIDGILTQVPIINSLISPIMRFSTIGTFAPLLMSAGVGLAIMGKSLKVATAGFTAFSLVPWAVFTAALPTISGLTQTLISFGMRGITASSGIISMATSLNTLGRSLNNVSSSFGTSTRSMAEYNKEKDRLKTVASAPKTNAANEITLIQRARAAAAMGAEISATRTPATAGTKKEGSATQVVQIKPIQIDLKLNGRQLQQLIVEANYNRT